ncbi:elongation factor P 5-aminopentanone reductase [Metabacillus fastidiosus]|uniref:SDR family oxidoreductase n=1 Tax=Metabacillus fastidiosus TaxID=1458 RepID=A0ABU6NYL7_9BACI|nr:SDR family oxidoreductase [Metabacillus fastidiosus]MED4401462.1 SDR family oxidoreductase [Metabacillus fastidiosus]MED4463096.1 SDR family oxidoreductase [Metabacillus fastidiosus]
MEKYALITGASGGIGTAIARRLAKEGYHLYLHYYQNEKAILSLQQSLLTEDINVQIIQADLSTKEGVQTLVQNVYTSVDLLVLNSGISYYGLVTDLNDEEIDMMIGLHIANPFRIAQKFIPAMVKKRAGNIIVISSIWGLTGAACEVLYSTVKGGQNAFVKALAKELAPSEIRVNAIAPGAVATNMLSQFSEEELRELEEEIPAGRLGKPEEIANTVAFLASDDSSYITGQILSVNGGWHC